MHLFSGVFAVSANQARWTLCECALQIAMVQLSVCRKIPSSDVIGAAPSPFDAIDIVADDSVLD